MATTGQTETKAKSKGGRKNGFAGFYVEKIDGDVIRAYVARRKVEVDTDVDDQQLALALALHLKKTVPADNQVRCENCHAISHEEEDACPFCGDEGGVEDEDEDGALVASAESAPEVSSVEADDDDADEEEAEDDEESDDEEDEDSASAEDDGEEDEDEEDEVEVAAAPPKKEAKKMSTEETIHVNGANGAAKKPQPAALAKTKAKTLEKFSESDLDKHIARFEKLKGEGYVNYWRLGQELLAINVDQLWKLRLDEDGKQKYRSFDALVHRELNVSPTHAYSMIDVAKNYATPEEIRELGGTSKAVLILKAVEQERPRLKEKAKAGATKRELEKEVAASRKKYGSPKQTQQAKAGRASKAAQQKAKPAEKITVANITGTRTIKLYKKPASMKGVEWPPEKRARTVGDQPFGRLELQPGVVQWFSVISKDGELVLNIQTVREG